MKATFTIEWRDDLGPTWMNADNLESCLLSATHCADGAIISVKKVEGGDD